MIWSNRQVPLSAKVLQQLITTDNSCVEIVKQERDITTLPYHGKKILNAIKEQLSDLTAKSVNELGGIVLGYKNIKLLSELGVIDRSGCLNFRIVADFFVFKPVPGKELPAVVTKKSQDHVGCLVYHLFNVSIPKPEGANKWTGNEVEIGQEIIIRVTYVKLDSRIPYIRGEFIEKTGVNRKIIFSDNDNTICDNNEDCEELNNEPEAALDDTPVKKKKKSRRSFDNEIDEADSSTKLNPETTHEDEPVKKKKKSRRSFENEIDDAELVTKSERKSKKRKITELEEN